jgi:endoglucanase
VTTGGTKATTGGTAAAAGGTKAATGGTAAAAGGTKATGGAPAAGGSVGSLPCLSVSGNRIVDPTGKTVILRGVSIEGLYDQSLTSLGLNGIIDKVTNKSDTAGSSPGWYTHIVRLPADPGTGTGSFGTNPDGYVNNTLKPIVDYATSKGLYAIIDLHYVDNPYNLVSQVNAFWTKVAPIFANYCNVLYEPFNESNQTDSWATYKPTMQAWVNLIRGFAPNNIILAGSPSWDQSMGDAATNPLTGTNIAYTVHMYEQHYMSAWNKQQAATCGAVHPIVMTEWGFNDAASQPGGADLIGSYGTPMLTWLEAMNGGWTAWCASNSWLPEMFSGNNWTLLVGPRQMGGFVKDWMYNHQN